MPVQAAQAAGKWLIEKFIVHGLVAAVALPMTLMSVSSLIDSQWTVVSLLELLQTSRSWHLTLIKHMLEGDRHATHGKVGPSGSNLTNYCKLQI